MFYFFFTFFPFCLRGVCGKIRISLVFWPEDIENPPRWRNVLSIFFLQIDRLQLAWLITYSFSQISFLLYSELNLPKSSSGLRMRSPRRSNLPVPKPTSPAEVTLRKKAVNGSKSGSPRNSLGKSDNNGSPTQSPRSSLYKETLLMNQQNSLKSSPSSSVAEQRKSTSQKTPGKPLHTAATGSRRGKLSTSSSSRDSSPATKSRPSIPPKPEDLICAASTTTASTSSLAARQQRNSPTTSLSTQTQAQAAVVPTTLVRNSPQTSLPKTSQSSTPAAMTTTTNNAKQAATKFGSLQRNGDRSRKPRVVTANNTPKSIVHKPGHIPSYLNKSTPSLSSSPDANKSRLVSRDLQNKGKFAAAHTKQRLNGKTIESLLEPRPLAPTAKFRSDGEISICDPHSSATNTTKEDEQQIEEKHQRSSLRASPPKLGFVAAVARTSTTVAKNAATNNVNVSSKSNVSHLQQQRRRRILKPHQRNLTADDDGDTLRESPSVGSRSSSEHRLSSDVQCWPWPAAAQLKDPKTSWKSASLGCESTTKRKGEESDNFSKVKSRSVTTFFQRRLGGLKRSLSVRSASSQRASSSAPDSRTKLKPNNNDQDWVFFRGFGSKRADDLDRESTTSISESFSSPFTFLTIPSEETRTRRRFHGRLRRCRSLTDAHYIAQAMYEGDAALLEELYPDFPRGPRVYPLVDRHRMRNRRNRNRQSHPSSSLNHSSTTTSSAAAAANSPLPIHRVGRIADNNGSSSKNIYPQQHPKTIFSAAAANTTAASKSSSSSTISVRGETPNEKEREALHQQIQKASNTEWPANRNKNGDDVTFSSSVMFVKQASDLQRNHMGKLSLLNLAHAIRQSTRF